MKVQNTVTNTFPIHIHQNGNPRKAFKNAEAVKIFNETTRRALKFKQGVIEVVTFSTTPDFILNIDAVVLSADPWTNRSKTQLALKYCQRCPKHKLLLFVDAWDSIFIEHPDALLNTGPLISGEQGNGYPPDCPVPLYKGFAPSGNSGAIYGPAGLLEELYLEARLHESVMKPKSDQYGIRIAAHKLGIPVDVNCQYFQTLAWIKPGEICLLDVEA